MNINRANRNMLKRALSLNSKLVKVADKNVFDRMVYTSNALKKDEKSVTRADLAELLTDVKNLLGAKFIDPAMAEEMKSTEVKTPAPANTPKKESSLKKTTKKEAPSTSALKEVAKEIEKKQDAPKKAVAPAKKVAEKVTPVTQVSTKERPLAKYFPKTIEVEGETYECARKVKNMKDIRNLLNEGRGDDLIFAFYWTKRHLVQFEYFDGVMPQPTEFKDDLDLCAIVYVSDADKVMYVVSMYTEALYTVYPNEIHEEKEGLRFAAGLEYQIYLKTETKKEEPVETPAKEVAETPAPVEKTEEVKPAPAPKKAVAKKPVKKATKKA